MPDSHQIEVIARPFLLAIEVVEVTVRIGSEDLSDLERVLADAAVERGDRAVVIDEELVIAVTAADDQAAVHSAVIVDSFNRAGKLRSVVGIEASLHQQGDEVLAKQEHIRRGSAVDRERVSPIIRRAGVMHVDEIIGPASGDVDEVAVGSTATVHVNRVAHDRRTADRSVIRSIVRRGHRRQLVQNDRVLSARESVGVTEDSRVADQRLRTEVDAISITSTRENDRRRTQRAVDVNVRSRPRIGIAVIAVDFERSLRTDAATDVDQHIVTDEKQNAAEQSLDQITESNNQVLAAGSRFRDGQPDVAGVGNNGVRFQKLGDLGDVNAGLGERGER